jgi:predicted nucleic acid-binding protein
VIVLDASAALELLLRTALAAKIEQRIFAAGTTLHAPHLVDIEVAQVLRRYHLQRALSVRRARQALDDFAALPISRYPHDVLLPRVWALRNNFSAYDAVYVALTEGLDAVLLTCDRRLANAHGHRARIELPV